MAWIDSLGDVLGTDRVARQTSLRNKPVKKKNDWFKNIVRDAVEEAKRRKLEQQRPQHPVFNQSEEPTHAHPSDSVGTYKLRLDKSPYQGPQLPRKEQDVFDEHIAEQNNAYQRQQYVTPRVDTYLQQFPDAPREVVEEAYSHQFESRVDTKNWADNLSDKAIQGLYYKSGYGRDAISYNDFRERFREDPTATLATMPNVTALPDWMADTMERFDDRISIPNAARRAVAYERFGPAALGFFSITDEEHKLNDQELEWIAPILNGDRESVHSFEKNRFGPFSSAVYSVRNSLPEGKATDFAFEMGASLVNSFEKLGAAGIIDSLALADIIATGKVREAGHGPSSQAFKNVTGLSTRDLADSVGLKYEDWKSAIADTILTAADVSTVGAGFLVKKPAEEGIKEAAIRLLRQSLFETGFDAGTTAVALPLMGISPNSPEYAEALAMQTALSAGGSVAGELARPGLRYGLDPALRAGAGYGTGELLGLDEDQKRLLAAGAAGTRLLPATRRGPRVLAPLSLAGTGLRHGLDPALRAGAGYGAGEALGLDEDQQRLLAAGAAGTRLLPTVGRGSRALTGLAGEHITELGYRAGERIRNRGAGAPDLSDLPRPDVEASAGVRDLGAAGRGPRETEAVEVTQSPSPEESAAGLPPKQVLRTKPAPMDPKDYTNPAAINERPFYHGTIADLTAQTIDANETDPFNLFGRAFYLTDDPVVAKGYGQYGELHAPHRVNTPKPRGRVYEVFLNVKKVLDLDEPAPPGVKEVFRDMARIVQKADIDGAGDWASVSRRIDTEGVPVGEMYERILSEARHSTDSRSAIIGAFYSMLDGMDKLGYDSFTHEGGLRAGRASGRGPHRVMLLLDPMREALEKGRPIIRSVDELRLDEIGQIQARLAYTLAQAAAGGAAGYYIGGKLGLEGEEQMLAALAGAGLADLAGPFFLNAPSLSRFVVEAWDRRRPGQIGPRVQDEKLSLFLEGSEERVRDHRVIDAAKEQIKGLRDSKAPGTTALANSLDFLVKVREVIDPATSVGVRLLRGVESAANFVRYAHVAESLIRKDLDNILKPFTHRIGFKQALERIPYVDLEPEIGGAGVLPSGLRPGEIPRFVHMFEHPNDFKLSPEQRNALKYVQDFREEHRAAVNEVRDALRLPRLPRNVNNSVHMWFKRESIEKVLGQNFFPYSSNRPHFLQELPIEKSRQLGDTISDAMRKHPGLELDGDVIDLLMREVDQKYRIRANGLLAVPILRSGQLSRRATLTEELNGALEEEALRQGRPKPEPVVIDEYGNIINDNFPDIREEDPAATRDVGPPDRITQLRQALQEELSNPTHPPEGMGSLPGFPDFWVPNDVLESISKLNPDTDEALNFLDRLTAELRTALFSLDGSAWTMNGAMAGINDPIATIASSPQLIAASVFGNTFATGWFRKNWLTVQRAAAAGLNIGREHGLLEESLGVKKFPVIGKLEESGFQSFLPVHRLIQWKNLVDQEVFLHQVGRKTGGIGSKPGAREAVGLVYQAAEFLPAPIAAVIMGENGLSDEEKFYLAAIAMGSVVAARGLPFTRWRGWKNLPNVKAIDPAELKRIEIRSAKHINKTSGVLNRQQLGISARRSAWERTVGARSPALARNTFSLARLAISDLGPEGQMARAYLIKTGLITAAGLAAMQMMAGEEVKYDPRDPDSIFNPRSFLRADLGPAGKVSPSNPWLSLSRALLYQKYIEGAPSTQDKTLPFLNIDVPLPANWSPMQGLSTFWRGRTPDIVGPIENAAISDILGGQDFRGDRPNQNLLRPQGLREAVKAPFTGSPEKTFDILLRSVAPVAVQQMAEAGVFPGVKSDPNYNSKIEQMLGTVFASLGLNYSPETLAGERQRLIEEGAGEIGIDAPRTAGGRINLSDLEMQDVRSKNPRIDELGEQIDVQQADLNQGVPDPVDSYFDARSRDQEAMLADWKEMERAVNGGQLTKEEYNDRRAEVFERNDARRAKTERDFGEQKLGREVYIDGKVVDPTVNQYLEKESRPEDKALGEYFDISDRATNNGVFDFETYDRLREQFFSTNPYADYVQEWLDRRDYEQPTVLEEERQDVLSVTGPYWELRDTTWGMMREWGMGLMKDYPSYDAFRNAVREEASSLGVTEDNILAILDKNPEMKLFNRMVEIQQRLARANDPALDIGLEEWYGSPAQNPLGAVGLRYGDPSFTNLGLAGSRLSDQLVNTVAQGYRSRYDPRDYDPYAFRRAFNLPDRQPLRSGESPLFR